MPAAKPVGDRHAVTGLLAAEGPLSTAGHAGNDRLNHETRNVVHVPRSMAVHAVRGAVHCRPAAGPQAIENVKDAAELRVERDDLDAAARDEADVSIVVEIDRPRIAG